MGNNESGHDAEEFQPKGAIAFFVLLIAMFIIMWFSLYFELLGRV